MWSFASPFFESFTSLTLWIFVNMQAVGKKTPNNNIITIFRNSFKNANPSNSSLSSFVVFCLWTELFKKNNYTNYTTRCNFCSVFFCSIASSSYLETKSRHHQSLILITNYLTLRVKQKKTWNKSYHWARTHWGKMWCKCTDFSRKELQLILGSFQN